MRQHLGLITPIAAALVLVLGSMSACTTTESTTTITDTGQPITDKKTLNLIHGFAAISPGDDMKTVVARLGPPIMDHAAPNESRVWQYERVQIQEGVPIVTFTGFITLNNDGIVTQVDQTKPKLPKRGRSPQGD
ncbi:MAG: hypothetical protein AWU57_175 [Marinobacter sp. T13-3]|nr:MAG: hypothetical protein AWU57_175 [Marinobacter sp. T13-3]